MARRSPRPQTLPEVEFKIFRARARWPVAPDLIFIAEAVDVMADAIWGSEDPDLDAIRREIGTYREPPERSGMLWTMVKMFERLFVEGCLTAHGRHTHGSGTTILRNHEWDGVHALSAVADGKITITCHDGVDRDYWIFIDRVEFELLLLLYAPSGGPPEDVYGNVLSRHDRMVEVIRRNIPAIARSREAALLTAIGPGKARTEFENDPTPEEFDRMFADAKRVLEPRHQIALEQRMAWWLVARFDEKALKRLKRQNFEGLCRDAFHPYATDEHLRRAWTAAISLRPKRFKPGRPGKEADS